MKSEGSLIFIYVKSCHNSYPKPDEFSPHAHYCRLILDSSICLAEQKNLYISDLYCTHNMLPLSHCLCFVSLDKWREARMLMKFWKAVKD
jgi:hypothetical protein